MRGFTRLAAAAVFSIVIVGLLMSCRVEFELKPPYVPGRRHRDRARELPELLDFLMQSP
jgi:hypothetical protein